MPVAIIIGIIILVLIVRGVFLERKKRLSLYDSFKNDFGKIRKKEYKYGKAHRDAILKRNLSDGFIDDITWSDLDMESVFERIDKCKSAVGEEYLYYMLHKEHCLDNGQSFDKLCDALSDNEKVRTDLLFSLNRLGYIKGFSPFDYLDFLTTGKSRFPIMHILTGLLYIPAVCLIFFYPIAGAIAVFLTVLLNVFIYFREKHKLEGIMESIGLLVRLSGEYINLEKNSPEVLDESYYGDFLGKVIDAESLVKIARAIKSKGKYLAASGSGRVAPTGNPLEVILTYVNILFHFDLITYELLIGNLTGNKDLFEYMLYLFGRIDAAISVADFRASLKENWCKPIFTDFMGGRDDVYLSLEEGYHPLVENFVSNSVCSKNGVLLTGSNASGKSTFLRMVAINAILAQSIGTVCAKHYSAPVFNIFSSIALKDNLSGNESYFIVEIKSVKRILDADCEKYPVLCFIDEVLRGTNTVERISASQTILKYFKKRPILCFAATHDLALADVLSGEYDNYHFSETVSGSDVYFDYVLREGKAVSRNALRLLRSYGFPEEIVREAENAALNLDS